MRSDSRRILSQAVHVEYRVAVAGCRTADGTSVFPDFDWPLLEAALTEAGVGPVTLAWDDSAVDWSSFDAVIVRSTWDSVDRPGEYLDWVEAVSAATELHNSAEIVRWNLDKHHLKDLIASDLPVVPTQWIDHRADWRVPDVPFVIKPCVSAGGRETARYLPEESALATAHVERLLSQARALMVQPFIEAVDERGETKMVYIDGDLSHSLQVGGLLKTGSGVMERPWEVSVSVDLVDPSDEQRNVASAVMAYVAGKFGGSPLYGRVDLVHGTDGRPHLLELELVDPSLSLWASPNAAHRLAIGIVKALKKK